MEEEKVVLDRKSFEALAVDTRVKILKSLKERRKTLSEIAKEQGMSVSGIKEHLETLEAVGLIEKKDDGHKWKYYELTKKGADIVAPRELRVWILLSISTIAFAAALMAIFTAPSAMTNEGNMLAASAPEGPAGAQGFAPIAASAPAPSDNGSGARVFAAADKSSSNLSELPAEQAPGQPDLAVPYAIGFVSGMTLLGCLGILAWNRMKPISP